MYKRRVIRYVKKISGMPWRGLVDEERLSVTAALCGLMRLVRDYYVRSIAAGRVHGSDNVSFYRLCIAGAILYVDVIEGAYETVSMLTQYSCASVDGLAVPYVARETVT